MRPWIWAEGFQADTNFELDPAETLHLKASLRRTRGDRIVLTDGYGRLGDGLIDEISQARSLVRVENVRIIDPPCEDVEIALGALHTQAMDWAVQKAVEVGVARFRPVIAARSQIGAKILRARLKRWRKMVREACKQCHRAWLMEIEEPMKIEELFKHWKDGALVAAANGVDIGDIDKTTSRRLLVGPEGGLSEHEIRVIDTLGWKGLRLGPHILRAETASIVGAALLVMK